MQFLLQFGWRLISPKPSVIQIENIVALENIFIQWKFWLYGIVHIQCTHTDIYWITYTYIRIACSSPYQLWLCALSVLWQDWQQRREVWRSEGRERWTGDEEAREPEIDAAHCGPNTYKYSVICRGYSDWQNFLNKSQVHVHIGPGICPNFLTCCLHFRLLDSTFM